MLSDLLDDFGVTQLVQKHPTRFSTCGKSASLLDLVITNHPALAENLVVLPPISDHSPVVFDLAVRKPQHAENNVSNDCPDYFNADWAAIQNYIWDLPLMEAVNGSESVDEAWQTWKSLVQGVLEVHIPTRHRKVFPRNKPWFRATHHRLIRRRDRLFAAAKRSNTPQAWAAYRVARNMFTSALRKAKCSYFADISRGLNEGRRGTYTWWKN